MATKLFVTLCVTLAAETRMFGFEVVHLKLLDSAL